MIEVDRRAGQTGHSADAGNEASTEHWEAVLPARDLARLGELRRSGAELRWSHKDLMTPGGQSIVHHFVEVHHPGIRGRLGAAGPTDFRYGGRDRLIGVMVRSVLGQALSRLKVN